MEKTISKAQKYQAKIVEALKPQFNYTNIMQTPRLEKICINAGIGDATNDPKLLEAAAAELEAITGQKPVLTRAKKAIATFKLRENQAIGAKVTLRGEKMWNFVENLVNIALPRVRDFKGLPYNSFDGQGNYTIGIKEQIIFPEINFDEVEKVRGMDVVLVTTAKTNEEAFDLLKELGVPFRK